MDLPLDARPLSFGSWIGGDRDGNPHVTAEVTKNAITTQVGHSIRVTLERLDALRQSLAWPPYSPPNARQLPI